MSLRLLQKAALRPAFAALFGALLALAPRPALGAEKKAETAAQKALREAANEYAANDYTQGLLILRKASKACATAHCSAAIQAMLMRDTGVLQLANGQVDKAAASFLEALVTDSSLEWNPIYDKPDLKAEWDAAKDEASVFGRSQPSGDFITVPPSEQVVRTAIPIYVEVVGPVKNVFVKYKATGSSEYKRIRLSRVGKGWGGEIPCGDVVRGVMRYYVQGLDENETPIAISGDPRHPLYVPIRWSITNPAPHLPGKDPPAQCAASGTCPAGAACGESHGEAPPPTLDNGEVCEADGQCTSGRCASGRCAPEHSPHGAEGGYVHFWFGLGASIDAGLLPGAKNVCLLNNGGFPVNSAHYYCTTPYGFDFPNRTSAAQNDSIVPGQAGNASSGITGGNVRVFVSFDYAVSASLLLGGRFGLIPNSYPGAAAVQDGRAFGPPIHLELRGTYLFGDRPLTRSGFAPMIYLGGGIAKFDVNTSVGVAIQGVPGVRPMIAFYSGGPGFAEVGAGLRYAFSPRIAMTLSAKFMGAFGGSGFFPVVAPELGVAYGF